MTKFIGGMILGFLFSSQVFASVFQTELINGTIASSQTYPELILIKNYEGECTGTLVGPSVFITAAHCGTNLSQTTFDYNGTTYTSTFYRAGITDEIDVALGLLDKPITGIEYASVDFSTQMVGKKVTLLGYGCYDYTLNSSSVDGVDYIYDSELRVGESTITEVEDLWLTLDQKDGAIICFGDSGGPTYDLSLGKKNIVGIHSEGDNEVSWELRLDLQEVQDFLNYFVLANKVEICGVNRSC